MFIKNSLKFLGLFFASIISLSVLTYLIAIACVSLYIHNEFVCIGLSGVLYSVIVLLTGYKLANKIKISNVVYFTATTLVPAIFCNVFLLCSNHPLHRNKYI